MKLTCTSIRLTRDEIDNNYIVSVSAWLNNLEKQNLQELSKSGKALDVEIKVHREQRSRDANAYMWVLCQKIAKKISLPKVPITKEEVYRKLIHEVGEFTVLPIRNDAVVTWIKNWGEGRTGWVCDNLGDSKIKGYTNIASYYGSSVYNTKQMSRLIDCVVEEAKEQGIETLRPEELAAMSREWGR